MKIYKYLKKEHLLSFKTNGSIRINTLYNLRAIEHMSIRDELEGRRNIKFNSNKQYTTLSGKDFHKLIPTLRMNKQQEKNITVYVEKGAQFNTKVADAYVFCASLKLDDSLYSKFGYDAHYAIHKPHDFAEILFEKLNEAKKIIRYFKVDAVKYADEPTMLTEENKKRVLTDEYNTFWDTCFTKTKNFSNEQEFRMVFVPETKNTIEPITLTCPELKKCCKF